MRAMRPAALAGAALITAFALTACAGGQSAAEACEIAKTATREAVSTVVDKIEAAVSESGGDAEAAALALEDAKALFAPAIAQVENVEVKAALETAGAAFDVYLAQAQEALRAGDLSTVSDTGSLQAATAELASLCAAP